MNRPDLLVFDLDGVLVEAGSSYRETIRATVHHFTRQTISNDLIRNYKNQGGWNNDCLLSQRLITDLGVKVEYVQVFEQFNRVFFGDYGDGLIHCERWLPNPGLLEAWSRRVGLAIFTGRAKLDAHRTLNRYARHIPFQPIVTDDSVPNPKPAPDGLILIQNQNPGKQIWFVGDSVDDARSARDAGIPFVGVADPDGPRHKEIGAILRRHGAFQVVAGVNDLQPCA